MYQKKSIASPNLRTSAFAGALALLSASFASGARASCEDLGKFPLTDGKITSAVAISENSAIPLNLLPLPMVAPVGFCRVAATLTPSSDSAIMAEVWLPDSAKWNGKFLGSGNGGFGGSVSGPAFDMRMALAKGYATAGDDLGHEITAMVVDGTWVIGHPEKVKDFAFRADHVTAEFAKALIAAYYGRPPHSPWRAPCACRLPVRKRSRRSRHCRCRGIFHSILRDPATRPPP